MFLIALVKQEIKLLKKGCCKIDGTEPILLQQPVFSTFKIYRFE